MAASRAALGQVVPLEGRVEPVDLVTSDEPGTAPATATADDWPPELAALYRERRPALVRVAYLLTSDAGAAEEIVQEAVIAVRRRWTDVEEPGAYLRTAVVNGSRSWLRRQRTRRRHRPEPAPVTELGADELWDALAVLRARERAAIVLRFYEDLAEDEIAAVLDCRPATVRSLVHRGLARLRKEIEP
jgi:RNA polymerase sigma-70 factor (sigma-E family)